MQQQRSRLRQASWLLGIAAPVLPGAFQQHQVAGLAGWAKSQGGPVCGMHALGAWLMAGLLFAVLALSASLLNGISLYGSPTTSRWRRAELALMLTPALLGFALVAMLAF
jgi:hypothetical protein